MRAIAIASAICLILGGVAAARQSAQPEQESAAPIGDTGQPALSTPPQDSAGPVAVPQPTEKALLYHKWNTVLWLVQLVWGWLVMCLFLFTGFSARIRTWAQGLGRRWFFVIAIYFVIYLAITFVVGLPLRFYVEYAREHAYGLSNQTLGKWIGDQFKALFIGMIIGSLVLWVPYLLLLKSPRRWWFYTGLASIPFIILMMLIAPIWITPLFNKVGPMNDKALEAKILALAERAGIEGSRVFEIAMSEDTEKMNAYVVGVGATKRIVLWDTLLSELDEPQVLFVMGHEMGHYVLGHIWKFIALASVAVMACLYGVHLASGWLIDKFKDRFGFDRLSDIASLPLLSLLFGLGLFVIQPALMAVSRHHEHQADRFGLEITHSNHAAATAFVKFQTDNLRVPRPGLLHKLWLGSHPSLGERIDFCNEYRPWEKNEPVVYESLFREAK